MTGWLSTIVQSGPGPTVHPTSHAYTERMLSECGDLTAGKHNRMTRGALNAVYL